jgi:hypothetical protein
MGWALENPMAKKSTPGWFQSIHPFTYTTRCAKACTRCGRPRSHDQ